MANDSRSPVYDDVEDLVDLRAVWSGLRRRAGLFAAVASTIFALTVGYLIFAVEQYTAETALLLQPKTEVFAYGHDMFSPITADPTRVETEVELLRSRGMALRVANRLRGAEQPAAVAGADAGELRLASAAASTDASLSDASAEATPRGFFDQPGPAAPSQREINKMLSRLEIQRVGTTFLIKIRFSSPSPEEAATIANAYAEEYIHQQRDAELQTLRLANQWIDSRLGTLRGEVRAAEEAAAMFRAEHGLVDTAGSFTERTLTGVATELSAAQTSLASAQARYNTVRSYIDANAPLESIGEVMRSPVVFDLRRQQAEITRRRAELQVRYGQRHPELQKINQEAAELQAHLDREVRRILESLRAEVNFAEAEVGSLRKRMQDARGELETNNAAIVRLAELERDTEATRGVYEALLNRQKELNERDRLADANARIIATAQPPEAPSKPRKTLLLGGGVLLALLLGGAVSFAAETLDTRIRNTSDIRREFGANTPVVLIPLVRSRFLFRQRHSHDVARRYVFDESNSSFAESLRDLRLHLKAAEGERQGPVSIAFTSVFKGEGKTTTAYSFACLLSNAGRRVAYIDCATGMPRFMTPRSHKDSRDGDSEIEYLEVRDEAVAIEPESPPTNLPVDPARPPDGTNMFDQLSNIRGRPLVRRNISGAVAPYDLRQTDRKWGIVSLAFENTHDLFDDFDIKAFRETIDRLRNEFDYVIIDAPAVLARSESGLIAAAADFTVLLTEWCVTTRGAARAAAQRLGDARARILTFGIAKIDERQRYFFRPEDRQFYFKKPQ